MRATSSVAVRAVGEYEGDNQKPGRQRCEGFSSWLASCCSCWGGVYAWQASVSAAERRLLACHLDERKRQVEKGRAAAAHAEQLVEQLRNSELELQSLRRILPEALGVDAFLARAKSLGEEQQVAVLAAEPRLERNEFFDTAEIAFELEGRADAAAALIDRLQRGPRLVGAEGKEVEGRRTRVRLRLFAMTYPEIEPHFEVCVLPDSRVWAPGLRASVRKLRSELESVCAEAETLAEEIENMQRLELLREALSHRIAVITELAKRENRPLAIDEEMEESEPLIADVQAAAAEQ